MRQLNRSYSLDIISQGSVKTITGLRISFEVKKTSIGSWNTAIIKLYNTNKDTMSMLNSNAKIRLSAGYGGINTLIYSGSVMNSFASTKGVIEIYSSDGERESREAHISKTYDGGFGVVDIITDIVSEMPGLIIGDIVGLDNDKNDSLGGTYIGEASEVIDRISKAVGFDWSIDSGVVTISKGMAETSNDIIEVNAATGMISSPTILIDGVEVRTLLNPSMLPHNRFEVTSSYASSAMSNLEYERYDRDDGNGIYTIQSVTHTGDTHDKDWVTLAKGVG